MDAEDKEKEHKKRFNAFDGLYHNEDGTVTTVDGSPVNTNVQLEASKKTKLHHHKKHHHQAKSKDVEDNIAEGEARTKEIEDAKA